MQLIILKENRGSGERGDIIEIRNSGSPWGGREPEFFVMIDIPDAFNDGWLSKRDVLQRNVRVSEHILSQVEEAGGRQIMELDVISTHISFKE